jgi:uncharacterized alkaline shock family protein YloU
MSRDGHVLGGPTGSIRIEGDALAGLVIAAAERVEGARVRRPRRGLDVVVADGTVRVTLELGARFGAVLPALGRAVQESIAEALRDSAGLTVEAVDITIDELDR